MYLILPKLRMPQAAYRFCASPHGTPEGKIVGDLQPNYLMPLGKSLWPDDKVALIVAIFKEVGFDDPLQQKLVEPTAWAFGGTEKDGVPDLSGVNWELLIDYFRFEAAGVIENDLKKVEAIKKEMMKKHNTLVSHFEVYADPKNPWY